MFVRFLRAPSTRRRRKVLCLRHQADRRVLRDEPQLPLTSTARVDARGYATDHHGFVIAAGGLPIATCTGLLLGDCHLGVTALLLPFGVGRCIIAGRRSRQVGEMH
jgi:hypothetical protein